MIVHLSEFICIGAGIVGGWQLKRVHLYFCNKARAAKAAAEALKNKVTGAFSH